MRKPSIQGRQVLVCQRVENFGETEVELVVFAHFADAQEWVNANAAAALANDGYVTCKRVLVR